MSALAMILHKRNHNVTGSDICLNAQTAELQLAGIRVFSGHKRRNLKHLPTQAKVIINGAIDDKNPELKEAIRRNLQIVDRAQLLAEIASGYKHVIAVAGTHGKSTTTAMIGAIFREAGLNPTIHNGAVANPHCGALQSSNNLSLALGEGEFFITEACEFRRSFLSLRPTVAVITNTNPDHMDCYNDFEDLKNTFAQFANQSGKVFYSNQLKPTEIVEYARAKYQFTFDGVQISLSTYGLHNVLNASSAVAVALHFGIDGDIIKTALENFSGIQRRFELLTKTDNLEVISDYAHHPAEIATTIKTAASLYKSFLIIFQPHTYTRTKSLFDEFVETLTPVDVIFFKTYSARENIMLGARAKDIAHAASKPYFSTKRALTRFIEQYVEYRKKIKQPLSAIIFTGAGDIDNLARNFCQKLG